MPVIQNRTGLKHTVLLTSILLHELPKVFSLPSTHFVLFGLKIKSWIDAVKTNRI